ncbi:M15 family metallopeptidase [Domibacillus aminovorans]|uniref:D-alanyl-D-alanine carboxypeptidase-like core domain-containing protein n=1 Tax=Domibacillus aminovorans TaxID=29332 RepID=A0A177L1J9_9BACI|nr:M15 family metallopeptidase [Domibacillus aminovorans]OAH59529.1 hypothetical protein AWH49_18425 [Domibacillus aminovorans]
MHNLIKNPTANIIFILSCILVLSSGCSNDKKEIQNETSSSLHQTTKVENTDQTTNTMNKENDNDPKAIEVVANPKDITVLVNKTYRLPENYIPSDLVYPDIPFTFSEMIDKRKMRKEAAEALKRMFDAAKLDGIYLAGVSGYRSEERQRILFENYVNKDGLDEANKYSAHPGHSEHQTGLSIDVSGISGEFAIEEGFANTQEAKWLEEHAPEYGFIIRFPKGKEDITGYIYEPWHIRYVGLEISKEIAQKSITLEEYFDKAIPVTK